MKYIILIFLALLSLGSCTENKESIFFKNCSCKKINFASGNTFSDSLGHYSVKYPSNKWHPIRNLDENGNGITGVDTLNSYYQIASITEIEKSKDWPSIEENLKDIEVEFNVLEKGLIYFKKQKCYWHLVKFDDDEGVIPVYTLYLGIDMGKRFYIINISVEQGKNYKKKLCKLESFIDQFLINK